MSNLIALGALFVAFIALIPSYYQAFYQNKKTKQKKYTSKSANKQINSLDIKSTPDDKSQTEIKSDQKPMPTMLKVIVLALTGVIIGLMELIIFSGIAYMFGVSIDLATMSLVWKIVFYSLFIVPGVFFWFAFTTFTTMLTD